MFDASLYITNISANGKYAITNKAAVYEITDNGLTLIGQIASWNGTKPYIDSTGRYLCAGSSSSIYDLENDTTYGTASFKTSGWFNSWNGHFDIVDSYILTCYSGTRTNYATVLDYSDVEYFISSTDSQVSEENKIYGIVPEDMEAEEEGIARGLFNTFTL